MEDKHINQLLISIEQKQPGMCSFPDKYHGLRAGEFGTLVAHHDERLTP